MAGKKNSMEVVSKTPGVSVKLCGHNIRLDKEDMDLLRDKPWSVDNNGPYFRLNKMYSGTGKGIALHREIVRRAVPKHPLVNWEENLIFDEENQVWKKMHISFRDKNHRNLRRNNLFMRIGSSSPVENQKKQKREKQHSGPVGNTRKLSEEALSRQGWVCPDCSTPINPDLTTCPICLGND